MPQGVSTFLKALGLKRQQNHLANEPGSLLEASNIIFHRDNVIQPRRGFKLYGTPLGSISDRAKQLFTYKNRILRYYETTLDFDTNIQNLAGQELFSPFCGSFNEVEDGLRIKSIESNGNFYFTTDAGIQKIAARTADDFSTVCPENTVNTAGIVIPAGGIKAVNLSARLNIVNGDTTDFFTQDSVVAYRVVWGYTDINSNLILGTPSDRTQIYNPLINLLINDFDVFLQALDNVGAEPGSVINDQDYVSTLFLPNTATALDVLNGISSLASKLDLNVGTLFTTANILSTEINGGICTISLNNDVALYGKVQNGDKIYLNGFSPDSGLLNGVQTVTDVTALNGVKESTPITFVAESGGNYTGKYFTLNSANNTQKYYVWFKVSGSGSDPNVPNRTGIQVNISSGDSAATIISDVVTALTPYSAFFTTSVSSPILTITNVDIGPTDDVTLGTLTGVISLGSITQGSASSISFSTQATGNVTLTTPSIESGWFRSYTVPDAPINIIATDQELVNIQNYLSDILTELQSDRNTIFVADNIGSPAIQPLEITTAAVTGTTTLTINFDTSVMDTDARNQFQSGDFIYLGGTWTTSGAQNISGFQTVATVSTGNITITLTTPVTNGAVTIDSTSAINRVIRYTDPAQSLFILPLGITTTATVILTITVPAGVTTNYFYQIYRSQVNSAVGTDVLSNLTASDEMALVYEAFPTQAQIDAGTITVQDVVLDSFRGANLYTNPQSGEGILQANDVPPLAHDINRFKNVIFYANTQTRQRKQISFLGVQNLIDEFNAGRTPQLTISSLNGITNTYSFVVGANEETNIHFLQAETGSNYTSKYFTLNSANNDNKYYVWYTVSDVGVDPMPTGLSPIPVFIKTGDSAITIAQKTQAAISIFIRDFSVSISSSTITITNIDVGYANDATIGTFSGSTISVSVTTQGIGELASQEITSVTTTSPATLAGKYWTINDAFNKTAYYVWYTVDGLGTDPAPANKTGLLVAVLSGDTSTGVANKTITVLNNTGIFNATNLSNVITVNNIKYGPANPSLANTSGFTVTESVIGALNVLLSTVVSPAEAVDLTAQSLVRIINQNKTEMVSAFYISSAGGIPGQILLEGRNLEEQTFYLLMNGNSVALVQVGASFSPNLSPTNFITNISAANPTVITSVSHGLVNGNQIMISGTNSTPNINGIYIVTVINTNTFTIPVNVVSSGNTGGWTSLTNANSIVFSTNEIKPNRIYYSKPLQPEAVPIVNFLDIGAQDKAIIRIFPLRDSLMVFKQDGLYRLSGEIAPWNVALFDQTCIITAPDSVSVANNYIYGLSTKGVVSITESGVNKIDRDIDDDIARIQTQQFTNFNTATWGIGYDSDKTYLLSTVTQTTDTEATITYVFNNLTNCWSTYDKTNTCGVINSFDDRLYLGAGDVNFIEQERKNFNRLDYADREFDTVLEIGNYLSSGSKIRIPLLDDIKIGDVLTQTQYLTVYDYNQLLKKLDIDPGLANSNYFSNLQIAGGVDLENAITNSDPTKGLAAALDADPNIVTPNFLTPSLNKTGPLASNSEANPTVFDMPTFAFVPGNVNTSTDVITITGSNLNVGQQVRFTTTGTLPGGLSLNIDYYVISPTTNTFQVSATLNGSAVNLTTQGTGNHTLNLAHGLVNNRLVQINNVVGSIPDVNGTFIITVVDPFHFSIPVSVTTAGTGGVFETQDGTFQDIRAIYNNIINMLNLDGGPAFKNYMPNVNNTIQESIITDINPTLKVITLNIQLQYVVGPLAVLHSILSSITYSPLTMGDPIGYKQINTCHVLFENQAFTEATVSFSTDLLPQFTDVTFPGFGNGTFGNQSFGTNFFGGGGNAQPFRTYIPRNSQRCTYMTVKFTHNIANEAFAIYGIGLSGVTNISDRSYR